MAAEKRQRVDWDAIEPHYRAGIRSLKDIGQQFEVSDAAIIKHAKKECWARNLKAKIQAKAEAKVSAALVSAEVSAETKLTEAVRIEVESEVLARIELAQRKDIGRGRNVVMDLLGELEHQTGNRDLYERLYELLHDDKEAEGDTSDAQRERDRKRRDAFDRAMSLGGRSSTMKSLAESLKTLVQLERQAYRIGDAPSEGVGDITITF